MASPDGGAGSGLRDYLAVLSRRKPIVIAVVGAIVGVSLVQSLLQTPVYEGAARVLLKPSSNNSVFDPSTGQVIDADRIVGTEIMILKSEPIQAAVRRQVGKAPGVSASSLGQVNVIEIRARDNNPRRAASITNAYANAYIDYKRTQSVDDLLAAAKEIQAKTTELQKQIDATNGPEKVALIDQQRTFKQRLDQMQVDAALKTGGAQVISPAAVPSSPVEPRPLRNAIFALAVGLLLGVGFALLQDHLDDSVKTKEEAEAAVPDIPVVALIPAVAGWKAADRPRVVSLDEPGAPASEAYRSLRTALQVIGVERGLKTLQVTSAAAQEGKTTTVANLGVALAKAGQRVVLVCCDLRHPRLHEFFGLSNETGVTSVLHGDVPLWSAVQKVPGVDRLLVLPSGPLPHDPAELLSSRRIAEVLAPLHAEGHLVVLDSPPVLPVTDALVLSRYVDATLLVGRAERTRAKDLSRAREVLDQVDAPLVGTVVNGIRVERGSPYGYGYYSSKDDARRPVGPSEVRAQI